MSLVVDASLVVALLADSGDDGRWAEDVIAGHSLVAPELLLVEAANILRRFESAGRLSALEAAAAFRELLLFDVDLQPFAPFAQRAWELRANITSYDGWYVAIAEAFALPLATLDHRLARAAGPRCRFVVPG